MSSSKPLKQSLIELSQLTGKVESLQQYVEQSNQIINAIENSKAYQLKRKLTVITQKLGINHQLLVAKYYLKLFFLRLLHQSSPIHFLKNLIVFLKYLLRHSFSYARLFVSNRGLFKLYISYSLASFKSLHLTIPSQKLPQPTASVDIIIPWYGDANLLKLVLTLKTFDEPFIKHIYVINDAYPDVEKLTIIFQQLKQLNFSKLQILHNKHNLGFIGTVNRGMKFSKNDVVLLNSDTLPTRHWITELRQACYSDKKVATATSMSNNATIFSLQRFNQPTVDSAPDETAQALKVLANTPAIPVPTAHGFCMYIRRSILNKYGYFDQTRYGKGYCEENDFSMRLHKAGYTNVAATKSYVVHLEGQSFGSKTRQEQLRTNYAKLLDRYPEYSKFVADCLSFGKLKNFQKVMNVLLTEWRQHYEYVLLINHSNIFSAVGGVERTTFEEVIHLQHQKNKAVLLYLYDDQEKIYKLFFLHKGLITTILSFGKKSQPVEILRWITSAFKIRLTLINHLMHHSPKYFNLLKTQGISSILFIHDYFNLFDTPDLLQYSEFARPFEIELLTKKVKQQKAQLLSQAETIVFNSEFTKEIYEKHLGKLPRAITSYPDQLTH